MNRNDHDDEEDYRAVRPNKTQLKRECDALQKIGEELIALKSNDLAEIEMPDELAAAIDEARRIKSRSGLKRQRQYIGKIMRAIDHEPIVEQLNKVKHKHDTNTAAFKNIEHWRDRLIEEGHDAVTELIDNYPNIDRQHINQLVRQAQQEKKREKPPTAARKLFKYLQEIDEQQE